MVNFELLERSAINTWTILRQPQFPPRLHPPVLIIQLLSDTLVSHPSYVSQKLINLK